MGHELLVNEQIEAGADFIQEFNEYASVEAALWINPSGLDEWYLYIASHEIDDTNFDVAYGEVLRRLSGGKSPWLDPFRIKLLSSSDPIAREAVQIRDRFPVKIPTRFNGSSIGGLSIDGAYIYPPLSAMNSVP